MITGLSVIRITGIFHRNLSPVITGAMETAGLTEYQLAAGRWTTLKEKKGRFGFGSAIRVADHPVDVVTLLVPPEQEPGALEVIINSGRLTDPGRGSVFSEEITIVCAHELCGPVAADLNPGGKIRLQKDLNGICCIVQRGEGEDIARMALDTGTCVPVVAYGHGTGLRDKLGLLRITIPAEKEIVTLMASSYDAETLMNLMITIGKLNQPGKGFIHLFPIRAGQINMKIFQGMPKHAASIEQIIVAIDEMMGGASWRARGGSLGMESLKRSDYLHGQACLTLTCNEGRGETLVQAAMQAGAPGATLTRAKHVCPDDLPGRGISPARDVCAMIMDQEKIPAVAAILEENGAYDDQTHGQLCVNPVPRAFTFRHNQNEEVRKRF